MMERADAEGGIIADVSDSADRDTDLEVDGGALDQMLIRLRAGEVRALARAVTLVEESNPAGAALVAACRRDGKRALRIGITGPPGAGKSTLVDQMVRWMRGEGQRVGVVAIDPSSPYTGGALLGDRIRMQGFAGDDGVYIRSMASRGTMGGLSRGADEVCILMEAAGFDVVIVETVGVGQDEVDVVRLADVTVLVLVPGMGDEIQSLKAGLMEVADVFAVNKGDREGAARLEAELLAMQRLGAAHDAVVAPVLRTVATTGEGVPALMEVVRRSSADRLRVKRALVAGVGESGETQGLKLDHMGIAVRTIAAARGFYELLGMKVEHEETVEFEHVKTAMLRLGESRIELLEATAEDSTIGRFVARRGEGLHHIAVHVENVAATFLRLQGEGVRLVSDSVRLGAGGHRYFFVHPASTGGVLVEIVGTAEGSGR